MSKGKIALIAIVVGIVGVIFMAINYNNKFVNLDQEQQRAWAQVENQLQRRFDLIPNLVETVKGYAKHEKDVLVEVTNARARVGGAASVPDKMTANNELSGALSRLLVVVERYPDLKANQNFLKLQDELAGTENRIAVERKRYNDILANYNKAIQFFPGSIFAGMFNYSIKPYFEAPKEAKTAPKIKF